jgi:hypothetical protein
MRKSFLARNLGSGRVREEPVNAAATSSRIGSATVAVPVYLYK